MNPFNSFSQQIYTPEMIDALEKELLSANDYQQWPQYRIVSWIHPRSLRLKETYRYTGSLLFYKRQENPELIRGLGGIRRRM